MDKIISGKTAYVFGETRKWAKYGYRTIRQKTWADGKITITMRKV